MGIVALSLFPVLILLPLLASVVWMIAGKRLGFSFVATGASVVMLATFLYAVAVTAQLVALEPGSAAVARLAPFFDAGEFRIDWGFRLDALAAVMVLVVTGVGLLIHVYSIGYMRGDSRAHLFFAYMNLFIAAMLTLVLADNLVVMFVGWEGVGLSSYLLIGFWGFARSRALANSLSRRPAEPDRRRSGPPGGPETPDALAGGPSSTTPAAPARPLASTHAEDHDPGSHGDPDHVANAAKKAFIVNRIGDVGVLLGIFLVQYTFGTVRFDLIAERVGFASEDALTAIALLLFLGAAGKSAQGPLAVWLPDAMAGPTPASALIHAATMVTAGVYLVARLADVFAAAPAASAVVAWVGVTTALLAALVALSQKDIKKVLAYSTISQLGFMFLAVGVGAYATGIFHLVTHAVFKALLFMAAGAVIHAAGTQDLDRMGGLARRMPVTAMLSLAGVLAIVGFPLTAGFFSKDAILVAAFGTELVGGGVLLWGLAMVSAVLTAGYMTRWYLKIFSGPERLDEHARAHLHEAPPVMSMPMAVLAALSLGIGFIGLPEHLLRQLGIGGRDLLGRWLAPVFDFPKAYPALVWELVVLAGALAALAVGWYVARTIYWSRAGEPGGARAVLGPLYAPSLSALGLDRAYDKVIVEPGKRVVAVLNATVDDRGIDASVEGLAGGIGRMGAGAARTQSGYVRAYGLAMLIGAALVAAAAYLVAP